MKVSIIKKIKIEILVLICIAISVSTYFLNNNVSQRIYNSNNLEREILPYEELRDTDGTTTSPNVKFSAYFAGEGGKKYLGVREELNKQVTLTADLSVLTEGTLKNACIKVSGNFYMIQNIQTDEYISGVNTDSISFNDMDAGKAKTLHITLQQSVVNSYTFYVNELSSKENTITFTGTYESKDGKITQIEKVINFRIDWYGSIDFHDKSYGFYSDSSKNALVVDERLKKVFIIYNVSAYSKKVGDSSIQAPDKAFVMDTNIPQLNETDPLSVKVYDASAYKRKLEYSYNTDGNRNLHVRIENAVDEDTGYGQTVVFDKKYIANIVVEYPFSAWVEQPTKYYLDTKATAHLEGYSTDDAGELSTVTSSTETETLQVSLRNPQGNILLFDTEITNNENRLSKANMRLNYEKAEKAKETQTKPSFVESNYLVNWILNLRVSGVVNKLVFSEDYTDTLEKQEGVYAQNTDHFVDREGNYYDMNEFVSYYGVKVTSTSFNVLGEDGYLDVYEILDGGEKQLLKRITSKDAGKTIRYNRNVKHIIIESSEPQSVGEIKIQNYKTIDSDKMIKKYTLEKFEKFEYIYSALKGSAEFLSKEGESGKLETVNGDVSKIPYNEGSVLYLADLGSEEYTFNPYKLNTNTMILQFQNPETDSSKNYIAWKDPTIFIEFPSAFKNVIFNELTFDPDLDVKVTNTKVENKNGKLVLKIYTEGIIDKYHMGFLKFQSEIEKFTSETYDNLRVFAYNKLGHVYQYYYSSSKEEADIYDINGDGRTNDETRVEYVRFYYSSANQLVTTTQIRNFDDKGNIVEGPDVASVEKQDEKTVTVNVKVANGYEQDITDVNIVGRIPFKGNKHVINTTSLDSEFSTTLQNTGIKTNSELKYTVYYSKNPDAKKDDADWTSEPGNWAEVKSYKIVIDRIATHTSCNFYYDVLLPEQDEYVYGQKTYATHAIYFKYQSSDLNTEPDKVGLQVGTGETYTLNLRDYKYKTNSFITRATDTLTNAYSIIQFKGENYGQDYEGKNDVTLSSNIGKYNTLYVGATYTIKQKYISDPYILNEKEIKFRLVHTEGNDYKFEILGLSQDEEKRIIKQTYVNLKTLSGNTSINVNLDIQNMYKYNLIIQNKVKNGEKTIRNSKFSLSGTKQYNTESVQTATDGTTSWNNLLDDTLKLYQTEVGEIPFDLNETKYRLQVGRNEEGKVKTEILQYLDNSNLEGSSEKWLDDPESERKVKVEDISFEIQPKVYVLIENDYKDAIIDAEKSYSTKRPNYVLEGEEITYKINITNSGYKSKTVIVKDSIPVGTTFVKNSGTIKGEASNDITEESLRTGFSVTVDKQSTVEVTFKVIANKLPDGTEQSTITNTANVDNEDTNTVTLTEYKTKMDNSIDKSGDEILVGSDGKVNYRIKYVTDISYFDGKAKITIVDQLKYPIDKNESDLANGEYDPAHLTITWTEIVDVNTYLSENEKVTIEKIKDLQLKYVFEDKDNIPKTVDNDVTGKTDLLRPNPDKGEENPDEYIIVKEGTEKKDSHNVEVKIPARVVVHHYLYDDSLGGETDKKLLEDEIDDGFVGDPYTAQPSDEINPNYECKNPEIKKGNKTEEQQDIVYYYELKDATAETNVTKTAKINGSTSGEIPTLTTENGKVNYIITQNVKINEYEGKAKIIITDELPSKIDKNASKLDNGVYDEKNRTITWEIERNINTFRDGAYTETITKNIEIVYEEQDVIEPLLNTVHAKLILYYPSVHTPSPGKERIVEEDTDEAEVNQKYVVTKTIEKIWDDSNNIKNSRPSNILVQLTANGVDQGKPVVLNAANQWKATFNNLPKYSENGTLISYSAKEMEENLGDLQFYETRPSIVETDNTIKITNKYSLKNMQLNSNIEKTGPEKITKLDEILKYNIHYEADISGYKGDAELIVVDYLPYPINTDLSKLNDGIYDADTHTITWTVDLKNINASNSPTEKIIFDKEISVVYIDMNIQDNAIENLVEATLKLWETESENKVKDQTTTFVQIPGKVIVHYKDKDTKEELTYETDEGQQQYQYEINGNVGDNYTTQQKVIPGYEFDSVDGNKSGIIPDGTEEVTYYYTKKKSSGVNVKWVDENENDLAQPENIPGKPGDPYHTEAKEFDNYELEWVEGITEGTLSEVEQEVIYHYKRKKGRVIVQYLEKGSNEQLYPEDITESSVGDTYTTERKNIRNYRKAEPEPNNKVGVVIEGDTYVTYYYEKIPSGKIVVKHLDFETHEEILNNNESYRSEQSGFVGDHYTTSPVEIPYYTVVETVLPTNREGVFEEEDKEVIYYYRKKEFNLSVDKVVSKLVVNGQEQKIPDGKLTKVEIVASKMNNTNVNVIYTIRVSNTGEIAGKATIIEKLPRHFTIANSTYSQWTENDDRNLQAEVSLEPGETKEFNVELIWKKGNENFGREINSVEIKDLKNNVNYPEKNINDNASQAEVIMSIKTGVPNYVFLIIGSIIVLIAVERVIIHLRKEE